jgi:pimeloyl-ACP methyl ester carboxylesterase
MMAVLCGVVSGCGDDPGGEVMPDRPAVSEPASLESAGAAEHLPVVTVDHEVHVTGGGRVFVRESFSPSSWKRSPRRAILLLSGSPTTGEFYNIPVDGYRGRELLAEQGFFAVTADFEGSGASTFPEDGFSLTFDALTDSMREVVDFIRTTRNVDRVDVLGEAEGGGVAAQLCADDVRIRSCTLCSMLYENGTDAFNAFFLSPFFQALIFGSPNGYLNTTPELYFNVLAAAPPEVAGWVVANQPGRYSMGMVAESLIEMPSGYDPTHARVPGLIIRGEHDQNAPASDTQVLAAAYGSQANAGPAEVVVVPGAMMIPRIEAPPHNEQFWEAVLDFVDP